jgi:diguanylate cyclase (GGDEF)-like protein
MRILLIDSDIVFSNNLKTYLNKQSYTVDIATNGKEGLEFIEAYNYALIILDIMLPKADGIGFCSQLRAKGVQISILILTERNTSYDKISGLDAGADDYAKKSISLPELEAKIRALLRRKVVNLSPILEWGSLKIDPKKNEVSYNNIQLNLTVKEYALLDLLMRNSEKIHSQGSILNQIWSLEDEPASGDTLRTLIKRLRQKLKIVGATDLIETIYGLGYRLNPAFQQTTLIKKEHKLHKSALSQFHQPNQLKVSEIDQVVITEIAPDVVKSENQITKIKSKLLIIGNDQEFNHTLLTDSVIQEQINLIITNNQLTLEMIRNIEPDIIILDISTENIIEQNLLILDRLSEHFSQIPIIATISSDVVINQMMIKLRKIKFLLRKPVSCQNILETIIKILNPVKKVEAKIMILDDDNLILRLLKTLLEPWGLQVHTLSNTLNFWERIESITPDLLILDIQMPDINGIELCQLIRNDSKWAWMPILFLTGDRQSETIQNVFAAGGDDFVSKPVIAPELITRIFNRLERSRLLREQAEIDTLTGLFNRHHSTVDLERLLRLAKQYQQPFCLATLSLDNLAQINRDRTHQVGDQMLRKLARTLQKELRSEDIIARWDGAEFLVGMYGITRRDCVEWLAEILELLRLDKFSTSDSQFIHATFSAGVTQYPDDGSEIRTLYQIAGTTLEKAQNYGGNCILPSNWKPLQTQPIYIFDVILLQQDSIFSQSLMKAIFTRGYHYRWLQEIDNVLEIVAGNNPSLYGKVILLDESFSKLGGLEILKQFKKDRIFQRSKVVWLSNQSSEVEAALSLGCCDYINIPCNLSAFMQRLNQILN